MVFVFLKTVILGKKKKTNKKQTVVLNAGYARLLFSALLVMTMRRERVSCLSDTIAHKGTW